MYQCGSALASWLVPAFVPRSKGPSSSPGGGHRVVFLGKTNCGVMTCDGLAPTQGEFSIKFIELYSLRFDLVPLQLQSFDSWSSVRTTENFSDERSE